MTQRTVMVTTTVKPEKSCSLNLNVQSFTSNTDVSPTGFAEIDRVDVDASGAGDFVVGSTAIGSFSFKENTYLVHFFVASRSDTFTTQQPSSMFLTGTPAGALKVTPSGRVNLFSVPFLLTAIS